LRFFFAAAAIHDGPSPPEAKPLKLPLLKKILAISWRKLGWSSELAEELGVFEESFRKILGRVVILQSLH
jgi:hypothetical protein